MAVRKGFPEGRSHSAHLLRYGSSRTRSGVDLVAKPCIWTKWERLTPHYLSDRVLGRMRPAGPESDPHSKLGMTKWLIREIKTELQL